MTEKIDLNSHWKDHGPEALHAAIERALRYPEFLIEQVPADALPGELSERLEHVYEVVGATSEIEREAYIARIAERFRLGRRVIRNGLTPHVVESGESGDTWEVTELFYGEVQEDERGFYFLRQGDQVLRVSNFAFTPIERMVEEDGGERMSVWIDTVDGKRFGPHVMSRRAWRGKIDFIAELDRFPDLLWSGSNDNVQSVRGLVARMQVPRVRAVSMIGRVKHEGEERFVWPGGVLGADGVDDSGTLRWLGDETPLSRGLKLYGGEGDTWTDAESVALMRRVLPKLFVLNAPEVMCAALGWTYACVNAPGIRKGLGHFPLLWLWATQGSGKSTLATAVLAQLVGLVGSPSSATDTPFAMVRALSASNCVPGIWDEFKSDMMLRDRQRFERFARRVYSGETETRGRADQSVSSYEMVRPMCICGELPPSDPALLERVVVASPLKSALTEERQTVMAELACEPLWRLAAPWYRFALGRGLTGDMAAARSVLLQLEREAGLEGQIGIRVRDNLLVMLVGILGLEAWCESVGVELPDVLDAEVFTAIVATCSGVEDLDELDEVTSLRPAARATALDALLRAVRDMAGTGVIEEGVHYALIDGELCVHLGRAYGAYLERQRARGLADETNGLRALRRAGREQSVSRGGYVVARSKQVVLGTSRLRCLAVHAGHLTEQTGIEPFPVSNQRTWGGRRWDEPDGDGDA